MASPLQEPIDHLIILPFEAWGELLGRVWLQVEMRLTPKLIGHVRALCVLAARLVQGRPLTITFFTTVDMYDRIDAELNRNFPDDKSTLKSSHIRSVVFLDM